MPVMPLARIHGVNDVKLDQVTRPDIGAQGVLIEAVSYTHLRAHET